MKKQATTAVTQWVLTSAAARQRLGVSQQTLRSVGSIVRYHSVKVKMSLHQILDLLILRQKYCYPLAFLVKTHTPTHHRAVGREATKTASIT